MFKDVSELKEFIVWAKSQKLKAVKLGENQFEFSDLALIEGLPDVTANQTQKDISVPPSSPRLPNGNAQATEDEETLFWSTRG